MPEIRSVRCSTGAPSTGPAKPASWTWHAAELQAATDFAEDLVALYDLQLRVLFVNRAAAEATGIVAAQAQGRSLMDLGLPPALCAIGR